MEMLNESMSNATLEHASMVMRSTPLDRSECKVRPWQQVVHDHNKKPMVISLKRNGQLVSTITGYRKDRKI